jgi:predicted nucleic acid-binding protein
MVIIDASILLLLLQPETRVPTDAVGRGISFPKERVEGLIADLETRQEICLIPTPALAEALVRTDPSVSQKLVDSLNKLAVLRIVPFDERAAIEVAAMSRQTSKKKVKTSDPASTWAKLKYDCQIVAIAKVHGAKAIYTDDSGLKALGRTHGLEAIGVAELQLPADKQQHDLFDKDSATEA